MTVTTKFPIILFDGVCNFCDSSVNFVIKRDEKQHFKFAPLQSEAGQKLVEEYGLNKPGIDSVILIENGRAYTHSTAALKIANQLGGIYGWAYLFIYVPRVIRDFFYKLFARNRYRLFGKKEECMIPTPEVRERFLT
ncbi:MAG TPA: thiol-disulfide oxidoreductase DCC family protein [Pyrinomonadaceae bacterium]|jgi:predicted DCC family thiol-disulfide oxidoreductase YuxK|nr:thiol-disulfide oxidoreductase DCC family protein [Pyrinomonadaceae bacterium]